MSPLVLPLSMLAGVDHFGSENEGWALLEPGDGEAAGPRVFSGRIAFERPFAAPPVVHLGLVGFDISEHDCSRLRVRAVDITTEGFSVRAETWLRTRVWSFDVSWLALGTA